jgi:hypothetical protein
MPSAPAFSSGGYLNAAAYSEELGVKNEETGASAPDGVPFNSGVGLTSQKIAIPNGVRVSPLTGRIVPAFTFVGPVMQILGTNGFALNKSVLANPDDEVEVYSLTGDYEGVATVANRTNPLVNDYFPKYSVTAIATYSGALPPTPGDAGALAGDPVSIPAGTYNYDPNLSTSVDIDADGEEGAARVYAVDGATFTSDSVNNFVADGEPQDQTLWSLVMGANTPTPSVANVMIDFELNPAALSEITLPSSYVASLGSFANPTAEALLVDQQVDLQIAAEMTFTGDEGDLTDFDPFPSGTTYMPLSDGEHYADGADAAIEAPEPASVCLFLVTACAAAMRRNRKTTAA